MQFIVLGVTCEKQQRGSSQAPLFVSIYRLRSGDSCVLPATSDFDENNAVSLAHDEVQFPVAAAIVLCNQLESAVLEPLERQILRVLA